VRVVDVDSLTAALRLRDRGDWRSWVIATVAGVAVYSASSQGLVILGGRWQLPLLVGFVVGLVSLIPWQGAVVSLGCVLGGMIVAPPLLIRGAQPGVAGFLLAIVLSPLAGAAPSLIRSLVAGERRKQLTLAMSAVLVTAVVVNFWMPLVFDGLPPASFGLLSASDVRAVPQPGQYNKDEGVYRRVFVLIHQGEAYYPAFRDAWLGIADKPGLPSTPLGFRLPTYYWIWRMLPEDPFAIIYAFLAFASAGIVAAAFIAGQLVGPRLAPLAAFALAAYALDVGFSTYAVFLDLPAMSIALVGVAIFLYAERTGRMSALWAGAAVVTLAALTREFLVYLVLFAAASAWLAPRSERLKRATPWLVSLVVFAAGYAAHTAASWSYLGRGSTSVSYFNGGIAYAADALSRFSGSFAGTGLALTTFVALGIVGSIVATRRVGRPFAAFACAAIVVPLVAMLFVGNPGHDVAGAANYWGMLFIPLALSLWPASALVLTGARNAERDGLPACYSGA
jgi:hypothetical protein